MLLCLLILSILHNYHLLLQSNYNDFARDKLIDTKKLSLHTDTLDDDLECPTDYELFLLGKVFPVISHLNLFVSAETASWLYISHIDGYISPWTSYTTCNAHPQTLSRVLKYNYKLSRCASNLISHL